MKASEENHILPVDYLVVEPLEKQVKPLSPVNFEQKKVYQMMINSMRVLRTYTDHASQFQHEIAFNQLKEDYFLVIMVVSLLIILTSISIVLFQIKRLEVIQRDIVSLYAYLSLDRIRDTHNKVLGYLKEIDEGSYLKQLRPLSESFHRWNINLARSNLSLHQYMEEEREDIYSQMIKKANEEVRLMNYKPPAQMAEESERRNSKLVRQKAGPVNFSSTMQTHAPAPEPKRFQTRALFKKMVKKVSTATKTANTLKFLTKTPGNPQARKALANDFIKTLKQKRLNNLNDVTSNPTLSNPKIDAETKMKVMKEVKEQENQAIEQRKEQFNKTYRYINKDRNFSVIFIGALLVAVFMALYFLNHAFLTDIIYLKDSSLVFFNRYKHLILTFSLSRERIFMNNSMASFESVPHYEHKIDIMYNDESVLTEQTIGALKLTHNSVLSNLIDQLAIFDSPEFCAHVISSSSDSLISINTISEQVSWAYSGQPVYQSVIDTVGLACEASRRGEIDRLKDIVREYEVNLNFGDYSRQNPLYYAVRARQTEIVRYLLNEAKVQVNIKDIWGNNAIDYTINGSELESLLLANGAKRKSNQSHGTLNQTSQSLQENELRVFYSAFYGSLDNLLILEQQGVSIQPQDPEGRTPLHVAATEGYFDIVKYLVQRGVDIFHKDKRGNDAYLDAQRMGNDEIAEYLSNVETSIIVKQFCKEFANGIYQNGMASAIGAYHKKFLDLQIMINSTDNFLSRLTLIYGERFNASKLLNNDQIFKTRVVPEFAQGLELYLHRAIESLTVEIQNAFDSAIGNFEKIEQIIFLATLLFLLLILLGLRRYMISQMSKEIFESRGILNLIPNDFFEKNKALVEGIMLKLKQ
ncbi:hypothetical protein FGO68_gene11594 [Halteria grandinella]|uniref:Ankyrin repeat domain-containing protein n=1 Tax=Halteria grandinella TaxID=5974 RepID=A0A8J8P484_HALGN|nr:hypothetical protein FGO68_gene11594 [Halteria grandinella]